MSWASTPGVTVTHTQSGSASAIGGPPHCCRGSGWSERRDHCPLAVEHDLQPELFGRQLGPGRAVLAELAGEGDDGHRLPPSSAMNCMPFIASKQ